LLACDRLTKSFGALAVVRGVTLDIAAGERHAIIGPNGAGKTTVFNLIGGVLAPNSGTISLAGADVTRLPPDRRARLGIGRSFQRNSCFAEMSVADNLATAIVLARGLGWSALRRLRGYSAVHDKVGAIAAAVGIGDRLATPARLLSYGTQRQLEVGIALAGDPKVLLLDEPTAGMSPEETGNIQALIAALPGTLTIVIIEHDMEIVFGLADRITVLDAGAVLAQGTPEEIRGSALVQARYLGEIET
jgi:branched-chain amino acid transport system ATP-binding protein